ncbi:MAG: DUF1553 domain-containing protein [Planctomycetaceae bacterium]|nr:DUF1553 domain-containing protein [Planctomycetaceae bacterium]
MTRYLLLLCLLLPPVVDEATCADDRPGPTFRRTLAPLLARHCLGCHSGPAPKGELDLSQPATFLKGGVSGAAVDPGKPEASLLWKRVTAGEMPPKQRLTAAQLKTIKQWILKGAAFPSPIDASRYTTSARAGRDWWSLQPLSEKPPPRPLSPRSWSTNPIDDFVLEQLIAARLSPSPPAARRTLARRLSFGLLGLPPDPDEIDSFVADRQDEAWLRLVDRWLAHPHYGERWARHWLDVVRFGESQGFERDKLRPHAWRYRDWVTSALNADMPYNRFAAWQLAGDVLSPGRADAIVATGFLVAGPYDEVGNAQISKAMKRVVRQDELEDIISVVGQSFLGLTIHCARCHDHKFDPIPQSEYYQLAAALDGVRHGLRNLPAKAEPHRSTEPAATLAVTIGGLQQALEQLEAPFRDQVLKRRRRSSTVPAPRPFARWDFQGNYRDSVGNLHATPSGDARIERGHLVLPGRAHLTTPPIAQPLVARTLEAWVYLDDTRQRGGGIVALHSVTAEAHDAIAFGQLRPGHWNLSSEGGKRSVGFEGPEERDADSGLIHLAFVFKADGAVVAYRNGQQYGRPIRTRGPRKFEPGEARILIGLRHLPPLRDRHIRGRIWRVQFHTRALSADEVRASAGPFNVQVSQQELLAAMPRGVRREWQHRRFEISQLKQLQKRWTAWKSYAVVPVAPEATHLLKRGNPRTPGPVVTAGAISSVSGPSSDFRLAADAADSPRRQALADWITDRSNPLFARVIVNRLWQHHFGVGLVETPSDFGFNGGRPSHPHLLDWLANQLITHDWSLKHIHRLILSSATYQQSSLFRPEAARRDSRNRLLWRRSPQRLQAEVLRDSLLAVSGSLNRSIGGPGYYDFTTYVNNSQFYEIRDPVGVSFDRRSLYRTLARSGRNPFLDAFDCPDPSTKTPRRAVTTTPLQALALLNNEFGFRMADRLARRTAIDTGPQPGAQVQRVFAICLGRSPSPIELHDSRRFLSRHGLAALARVLFNSNEFLYVD